MALRLRALLVAAFATLSLSSARADDMPQGGMTLQQVSDWLAGDGLKSQVDPAEHALVFNFSGQNIVITMGDCAADGRCRSLQYYYGIHFEHGLAPDDSAAAVVMNNWNRDHRWTRAYADKDRDPCLEMDVSLVSGMGSDGLNDSLKIFLLSMTGFRKFVS